MTITPTKEEVQSFHQIDRRIYSRLVFRLGQDISLVMRVMALWLWLEEVGYPSVILPLHVMPDNLLLEIFYEAITVLRVLQAAVTPFTPSNMAIPRTFYLLGEQINLTTLYQQSAMAMQGISETLSSVCARAFGDNFLEPNTGMAPAYPASESFWPPPPPPPASAEGKVQIQTLPSIPYADQPTWRPTVPFRGLLPISFQPLPSVPPTIETPLSPQHTNMTPRPQKIEIGESSNSVAVKKAREPIRKRTIFVTFSRGFPVSEEELFDYITRTYGDIVVDIHLAETSPDEQPLWARVVLRSSSAIDKILKGEEAVRFVIKGKYVWTRRWRQNRLPV